jgi:hypothetical protein
VTLLDAACEAAIDVSVSLTERSPTAPTVVKVCRSRLGQDRVWSLDPASAT